MVISHNDLKVVMIHEVDESILNIDLSAFDIITFDDGLYTQYKYHNHFLKFNKRLIYFISTNIICPNINIQSDSYIKCYEAHKKAFKGCFENYMTWEQIIELSKIAEIGSHSHNHIMFKESVYNFNDLKKDIDMSLNIFKEKNIYIKSYCKPYNQHNKFYDSYVKKIGLELFGDERIPVETLII